MQTGTPKVSRQRWFANPSTAIPLVVAIAAFDAYSNALFTPFVFDDVSAIVANADIKDLGDIGRVLGGSARTPLGGRPVVALTFAFNYALGGLAPWGYHAVNLLIHIVNALLVFGILRRTRVSSWIAGAVALVWSVHPLNTEAVTYVVQRTELVVSLFYLLTLYCTIRGWYAGAVASCLFGMASKEVMAGAPLVVLLYDRIFLSGSFRAALRQRRWLYVGLASTWLVLGALVAGGARSSSVGFDLRVTVWDYLKTQATVIAHYLRIAVWPDPLVLDYADWPVATRLLDVLPAALFVFALLALTAWALYRRSWTGMLGAWFFLILAPSSSVVPIVTEMAAERRMYLPLVAVVTLPMVGLHRAYPRVMLPLTCALTLTLGYLTLHRNADYRTEIAIFADTVEKRPANARAHNNLATAWLKEGRMEEGISHLSEAIRLQPRYAHAHHNLGVAYHLSGRHDEAIRELTTAINLDPSLAESRFRLATAYLAVGQRESAVEQEGRLRILNPALAAALREQIGESSR